MALLANIASGKYDDSLDRIIEACKRRKSNRIYSLRVGDKVRFPLATKPAYLGGEVATIIEWRRSRVLVQLDGGAVGRFRGGRIIAHAESLTPVEPTDG